MNKFDKNFLINFSPLLAASLIGFLLLVAFETKASDIEEVVVVGQQERTVKANPITSSRVISAILPGFTYNAGGYGGFIGFAERGAQTNHTSVFVNGIPANDPGAGWYDFGHDMANGQTVKVITGANSVLYGSGSMAGTVLIQDTIEHGITVRTEDADPTYIRIAPTDFIEFSTFDDSMGSVRNDNEEIDNYKNKTARLNVDVGDFTIVGKVTEYEYDYDNCYDYNFGQSNDCLQDGERYNIAIRNDFMTIGRNYNNADYFTVEDPTYSNESFRDFARFGSNLDLSNKINVAFGVDMEKIYYNTISWQNVEGTTVVETENTEPGIWYAEDDTNKSRPMWTGIYIGTGEFTSETVGNGVYTLTEIEEKYTDENAGLYFSANAKFILDYNFGIRVGNDDQNALRLGISKGEWFVNIGNSFRKPNLYELNGDGYVEGNAELMPEEAVGIELGYGAISVYRYDFQEAIEYIPGYNTDINTLSTVLDSDETLNLIGANPEAPDPTYVSCVLNPNWNDNDEATFDLPGCIYKNVTTTTSIWNSPTYSNTGAYVTQGLRYSNNFGPMFVSLKYTDTEQVRIPKYIGVLQFTHAFNNGINVRLKYAVQLDRAPGQYDVLMEGEEFLEDLQKVDLYITKVFENGITLSFKGENLTDEVVEVVPMYNTQGTEYYLTLGYKW